MVKPATKPKVSKAELKYRKENVPDVSQAVKKNVLCTVCNASIKPQVLKGKVLTHPFLETLLCQKCHDFYGDGEFSVDEDGSDKYCRWCGQGGTLYLCSTCTAGFCRKCIKRNLTKSCLKDVDDDDWRCYCCVVDPLYELRATSWAAQEYAKQIGNKKGSKTIDLSDSDESDHEKKEKKSSNNLSDTGQSNHESKKEKSKKRKHDSEDEESSSKIRQSERSSKKRTREDDSDYAESTPKRRSERTPKRPANEDDSDYAESTPKRRSERNPKKPANEDESEAKTSKSTNAEDKESKSSKTPLSREEKKLYKRLAVKFTTVLNDASKICDKVKTNVNKCKAKSHNFTNMRTTEDIINARESISGMLNSIKQLCVDMTDIVSTTSDNVIAEIEKLHEAKEKNGISDEKKQEDHSDEDKNTGLDEKETDLDKTLESEANDVSKKFDESLDDEKSLNESDEGDSKKIEKKSEDDMEKSFESDDGQKNNHEKSIDKDDENDTKNDHEKSIDDEDDENDTNRSNLDNSKDE